MLLAFFYHNHALRCYNQASAFGFGLSPHPNMSVGCCKTARMNEANMERKTRTREGGNRPLVLGCGVRGVHLFFIGKWASNGRNLLEACDATRSSPSGVLAPVPLYFPQVAHARTSFLVLLFSFSFVFPPLPYSLKLLTITGSRSKNIPTVADRVCRYVPGKVA